MSPEERAKRITYALYLEMNESIVKDVEKRIAAALRGAVEAEREACAQVCDKQAVEDSWVTRHYALNCAREIRALGEGSEGK